MNKCCKIWIGHIEWLKREEDGLWNKIKDGSLIFIDLMPAKFCPDCGSKFLGEKLELPERYFADPTDFSFDTKEQVKNIMEKFDKLITWLKTKDK